MSRRRTSSGWTEADIPDQSGRVVVVTGANSGIGLETSRQLAARGATVVLACRRPERAEAAIEDIRRASPDARLSTQQLDLASLRSVRDAAEALRDEHDRIDVLVNNAGIMYTDRGVTEDGFELQFGTNHLGHFALTGLLLDRMLDTPGSRVVTVGSMGHWLPFPFDLDDIRAEGRYNRFGAYARSKVANLMFALALQRRLARAGASTISLASHPGGSNTELAHQLPLADLMSKRFEFLAQTPAMGALGTLRAITDPTATGGQYYGPNRRLEMKGHPIVVRPSARTQDEEVQEELWTLSEKLTGVRVAIPGV